MFEPFAVVREGKAETYSLASYQNVEEYIKVTWHETMLLQSLEKLGIDLGRYGEHLQTRGGTNAPGVKTVGIHTADGVTFISLISNVLKIMKCDKRGKLRA